MAKVCSQSVFGWDHCIHCGFLYPQNLVEYFDKVCFYSYADLLDHRTVAHKDYVSGKR